MRGAERGKAGGRPGTRLWGMRPEQVRALASAVRHDIIDQLIARGSLSVRELAESLQRKPTAIYRHLRLLERVRLVRAARAAPPRGRPGLRYRPAAALMRRARSLRRAGKQPLMARVARTLALQAGRDYARAFRSGHGRIEGPLRNHWFFRRLSAPSAAKLRRINALLDALAVLLWTPEAAAAPRPQELVSFAWFVTPAGTPRSRRRSVGARRRVAGGATSARLS